jgi:hypothetical protein
MRAAATAFLPDRLRPRLGRRPRRRRLALLVLVPGVLALLPWWRIQAVEFADGGRVPAALEAQLRQLVGTPALALDLGDVRRRIEAWPGVESVDVQLELPGRLRVVARPAPPCASIRSGNGWHGIAADGSVTGPASGPLAPVLEAIAFDPVELRSALAVVSRVATASGAAVQAVRAVAPGDLELTVRTADGRELVVLVGAAGSGAEGYWCDRVASGDPPAPWSDARSDDRLVIGGAS